MYPDREKALAKGRRKGKTFIRVFCGIFISVGIILLVRRHRRWCQRPHIPAKG